MAVKAIPSERPNKEKKSMHLNSSAGKIAERNLGQEEKQIIQY